MFSIYAHITTGSDRGYVTLTCVVIRVHSRSLDVTDGQILPTTSRDAFFAFTIIWQMQFNIACMRMTLAVFKDHRMSNLDHRRSNLDHRRSNHDSNSQGCIFCHVYSCDLQNLHRIYECDQ